MKKFSVKILGILVVLFSLFSFTTSSNLPAKTTVKCLLQTKNYSGEGAYIVVLLIDPKGNYEQTLYMQGQDEEWYDTLQEWWKNVGENAKGIDAISGATINPGARTVIAFEIPSGKIDAGYHLRFESAVEDQEYYKKDLELALTKENLKGKFDGEGFIRYVRLMSN